MEEIGKNLYVYEYDDEIILVDCGLAFPDETTLGVDIIIPDVSYLRERKRMVKAVVITHAHEDHIGALPHVLPEFPGVPVYASTLARGLLANKLKKPEEDAEMFQLEATVGAAGRARSAEDKVLDRKSTRLNSSH